MWYKVLDEKAQSIHGGRAQWFPPQAGEPGEWMPKVEHIIMCQSGYHLVDKYTILQWLGPSIWKAEPGGISSQSNPEMGKIVAQQARLIAKMERWHKRSFMSFTADCMDHADGSLWMRFCEPAYNLVMSAKGVVRNRANKVAVSPERVALLDRAAEALCFTGADWGELVAARLVALRLLDTRGNDSYATWWKKLEWVISFCRRGNEDEYDWQVDRLIEYIEGRA